METAGSKKWSTEEPREEVERQMPSRPSTSSEKTKARRIKQKKSEKDNSCKLKEGKTQDTDARTHS